MRLPEIEGRGIFFRSHTFICVCPKLLFSVVWENYSGPGFPTKTKLAGSWAAPGSGYSNVMRYGVWRD